MKDTEVSITNILIVSKCLVQVIPIKYPCEHTLLIFRPGIVTPGSIAL